MRKVIFIDRDGVINKDPGGWTEYNYVTQWEDFHFLPGVLEALSILKKNGIKVLVASNQGGVNKGYYSREKLDEITGLMLKEVKEKRNELRMVELFAKVKKGICTKCKQPASLQNKWLCETHRVEKAEYMKNYRLYGPVLAKLSQEEE